MIVFCRLLRFYACVNPDAIVIRDKAVLDACPRAEQMGIQVGMSLSVAKAILAKESAPIRVVKWIADDYEAAQKEWLDSLAPLTDVIEPVDQHEAYLDLSMHPRPEELLGFERGSRLRMGIARTKWLAKVALEMGDAEQLAYYAPNAFLDELPTRMLEPVQPESRTRLEFLGYRTAGAVATLSLETLKAQFGKEALTIWQAARGRAGESVEPRYPEATLGDRICFSSPVDTREPLDLALGKLSRRLGKKLQDRDLQASILRLWIGYEDEPEERVEREFAKPMQGAASLRFAATQLCQPKKPVTHLRMQLPELRRANRKQQMLYVARTDSDEAATKAVGQIQRVFGSETIKLGRELKPARRQLLMRAWKDATGWA